MTHATSRPEVVWQECRTLREEVLEDLLPKMCEKKIIRYLEIQSMKGPIWGSGEGMTLLFGNTVGGCFQVGSQKFGEDRGVGRARTSGPPDDGLPGGTRGALAKDGHRPSLPTAGSRKVAPRAG